MYGSKVFLTNLKTFKGDNCLKVTPDPFDMNRMNGPLRELKTLIKVSNIYLAWFKK